MEAERDMRRAADGFAAVGDRFSYTICATHGAELAEMRGDYDRAVRMLEESLAMAEDVGFSVRGFAARSRLANMEILRGNLSLAASIHHQALASASGPIPQWMHAITLLGLANIARRRGPARRGPSPHRRSDTTAAIEGRADDPQRAARVARVQRRPRRRCRDSARRPARSTARRAAARGDQGRRPTRPKDWPARSPCTAMRPPRPHCWEPLTRCAGDRADRCRRPRGSTSIAPNADARDQLGDAFAAAFPHGARPTRRSAVRAGESQRVVSM